MNRKKGFTLLELVVVIMIIGILATLAISNVVGQTAKARDSRRKADLVNIQKALELYYADNNAYPSALKNSGSSLCHPVGGCNTATYMLKVPDDPKNIPYLYCHPAGAPERYQLYANLEFTKDPQIITPAPVCAMVGGSNFGVSSPNINP